jgi:hypothetical protein
MAFGEVRRTTLDLASDWPKKAKEAKESEESSETKTPPQTCPEL